MTSHQLGDRGFEHESSLTGPDEQTDELHFNRLVTCCLLDETLGRFQDVETKISPDA